MVRLALPLGSLKQCILEGVVYSAWSQHRCRHVQAPAAGPCIPVSRMHGDLLEPAQGLLVRTTPLDIATGELCHLLCCRQPSGHAMQAPELLPAGLTTKSAAPACLPLYLWVSSASAETSR